MHKKYWNLLFVGIWFIFMIACSTKQTDQELFPEQILPSGTEKPQPTSTPIPTSTSISSETSTPLEEIKNQVVKRTIHYDGLEREYFIYVPENYTGDEPIPLLFSYHGYTATAEQLMDYVDFFSIADKEGFMLVYPQGSLLAGNTHWNVGGWTNGSTSDDVGFTAALIDVLAAEFNIDTSQVYALGHSNGGFMSFRLACDLSAKIAAIVSVSGSMTPEIYDSCNPDRPVPVMQIHGTADETVPYEGAYWSLSIAEMLEFWVGENECEPVAVKHEIPHSPKTTSDTSVEHTQYVGCNNNVTVEHYKHIGGGHGWLGTVDDLGQSNVDLEINEEIWAFLSQHQIGDFVE